MNSSYQAPVPPPQPPKPRNGLTTLIMVFIALAKFIWDMFMIFMKPNPNASSDSHDPTANYNVTPDEPAVFPSMRPPRRYTRFERVRQAWKNRHGE